VAANREYAAAHAELGLCLIRLRHFDEAISSLREAVRLDANNAQAWTNLGSALYQSGRVAEAATAFGRALEIDPNLAPARRGASLASSARQDAR